MFDFFTWRTTFCKHEWAFHYRVSEILHGNRHMLQYCFVQTNDKSGRCVTSGIDTFVPMILITLWRCLQQILSKCHDINYLKSKVVFFTKLTQIVGYPNQHKRKCQLNQCMLWCYTFRPSGQCSLNMLWPMVIPTVHPIWCWSCAYL